MNSKPGCVLFSGGADSTLAAFLVSQTHQPIHLLTFRHRHMSQLGKSLRNVTRLKKHLGEASMVHRWLDLDPLWNMIHRETGATSLRQWGSFSLVARSCLTCKAAMHLLAASYCIKSGITFIADGAHPDGATIFPEQLPEGIDVLRSFYQRHGIQYENPVYRIDRPDVRLFELGVTEKKNTKSEHLYYSNQFACHVGLIPYFYSYCLRPLSSKKRSPAGMTIEFLDRCFQGECIGEVLDSITFPE